VYNVTDFLGDHPGGKKAILLYAGKDATEEFLMLHKPDIIVKVRVVVSHAQLVCFANRCLLLLLRCCCCAVTAVDDDDSMASP
jgi:hypothetical protein